MRLWLDFTCRVGKHRWIPYEFPHSHMEGPHCMEACDICGLLKVSRQKMDAYKKGFAPEPAEPTQPDKSGGEK